MDPLGDKVTTRAALKDLRSKNFITVMFQVINCVQFWLLCIANIPPNVSDHTCKELQKSGVNLSLKTNTDGDKIHFTVLHEISWRFKITDCFGQKKRITKESL